MHQRRVKCTTGVRFGRSETDGLCFQVFEYVWLTVSSMVVANGSLLAIYKLRLEMTGLVRRTGIRSARLFTTMIWRLLEGSC
jgi:hypothetical protein